MNTMSVLRRCVECGSAQIRSTTSVFYPESGLKNVQLLNVPVWTCENGHEEIEIPAVEDLYHLLAHMVVRQPAPLSGRDVRFLRKRIGLTAKQFAAQIGRTPEWISQIENGHAELGRTNDLLFRLALGLQIAAKANKSADDLTPLIEELESSMDIAALRVRHDENASPNQEWIADQ